MLKEKYKTEIADILSRYPVGGRQYCRCCTWLKKKKAM